MLDISLEFINLLKRKVDLYVIIEITPRTKRSTIINIENLPDRSMLVDASTLLSPEAFKNYEPYFAGTRSVKFAVHPHKTGLSLSTLQTCYKTGKFIKDIKPDVLHFELEAMSLRGAAFTPYLRYCKELYVTVHDPVLHLGTMDIKLKLARYIYNRLEVSRLFFYSGFSKHQYERVNDSVETNKYVLPMQPYSFYTKYLPEKEQKKKHILFFGRMAAYKGLDTLLESLPAVLEKYPNEQFLIVGKSVEGFNIDDLIPKSFRKNVTVINRYINNEALVRFIKQAKFIVCPYKDASQSGVLMTSFALDTPVVATNVGAFSEFIEDEVNGILIEPNNPQALSKSIICMLKKNKYQHLIEGMSFKNKTKNHERAESQWLKEYVS